MALTMFNDGLPLDIIAKYTGLSQEEIQTLHIFTKTLLALNIQGTERCLIATILRRGYPRFAYKVSNRKMLQLGSASVIP